MCPHFRLSSRLGRVSTGVPPRASLASISSEAWLARTHVALPDYGAGATVAAETLGAERLAAVMSFETEWTGA